jgi:peptide/nickel transport system substrate-binding protein
MTFTVHLLIRFLPLILAAFLVASADAKTLRWSGAGELVSCDPAIATDTAALVFMGHMYERLVTRDRQFAIAPSLALSWERLSPTATRFKLRPGVRFHDGTPFTADDVAFSIERARETTSLIKSNTVGIKAAVRIDDLTLEIHTEKPLPTLLNQLYLIPVMSRSWASKHGVTGPANYVGGKENFATRNANGTGPYVLKSFESGGKVVLTANPNWWGKMEGNITEGVYVPIRANATRVAAFISGEVDLLIDPPVQDLERLKANPQLKLLQIPEPRVILLQFDQERDELLFSTVKGKNPFKDRRVREAVRLSIDSAALHTKVMRGNSIPTTSLIAKGVTGYSAKADQPARFDIARAKLLLAEAGYPHGFGVTLDCTNDRYILDESLCSALAGMMGKIGIVVSPNPKPKAIFFQKTDAARRETSFMLIGYYPTTADGMVILDGVLHTYTGRGQGDNNTGRYSNKQMDALLEAAQVELDAAKRNALMEEILLLHNQDVASIPIHQQLPSWAMRRNIDTPARRDNGLDLRWVVVK